MDELIEPKTAEENGNLLLSESGLDFEDALEETGNGPFHYALLLACGWALSADSVQVLSLSFVLPAAQCDMDMSSAQKGLMTSLLFVGMTVGGYFWGFTADLRGRRSAIRLSLAIHGISTLAEALAPGLALFACLLLAGGFGVGGNLAVTFSYFVEFQPCSRRGQTVSMLASFWMTGNIVAAGLAWAIIPTVELDARIGALPFHSWRLYMALCSIPSLSSALIFACLPESPKFLLQYRTVHGVGLQRGEEESCRAVLRTMARVNRSNRSPDDFQLRTITSRLFQRNLRRSTWILIVVYFTLSYGYYGLFLWFPELFNRLQLYGGSACELNRWQNASGPTLNCSIPVSAQAYRDGFVTASANLPGNVLSVLVMDRVARKVLLCASMLLSAASVFAVVLVKTHAHSVVLSCVFSGVSVVGWNALDVLTVELFPTDLRSTAFGLFTGIGRLGAILANLTFGFFIDVHCSIPMVVIAVLLGMGSLSSIPLPNRTGQGIG